MRKVIVLAFTLCAALAYGAEEEEVPDHESTPYSFNPGTQAKEEEPPKKDQKLKGGKTRKELAEGYTYCQYDNCYELLGVEKTSGLIAIKRAYRRLANEFHPDKCVSGDVQKCRELFPKYAAAYEILSNSEMRKNYDYVLENPYEFPSFYLTFSRPSYAPKTDLRFVFVFTILLAAAAQHYLKQQTYAMALAQVKKDPRFRYTERLKEIMNRTAASPKKATTNSAKSKGPKGEELEKKKKEAEAILNEELAQELPPAPTLADNVAVGMFKLPLTTTYNLLWFLKGGMREPGYKTRKALGLSEAEWATVDEEEQAELVGKELWVSENLEAYEAEFTSSSPGKKSGKEKRMARQRKKELRNPSAMQIDD